MCAVWNKLTSAGNLLKGLFPVGGGFLSQGALSSTCSKDSGDISAMYRVNEDDNDE